MKKKYIIIIIGSLFLVSLLSFLIYKNNKKYIMQDGIMLALTLDGKKINSYPEGTNYFIDINCENGKGKWLVDEWKLAVEDVNGSVTCNIDFISNTNTLKQEVQSKAAQVSLTNYSNQTETSHRFIGKQPNNWVWFNNEKWRIIGDIPVCMNSTCNTKENLVKIIRNESIGGLAIHSYNNATTWGSNILYTLLNSYYYGKDDATGSELCYGYAKKYSDLRSALCNYKVIGISKDENDYYGPMIKNVYWNIGTLYLENLTIATGYKTETSSISTTSGRVGLMNASDYGYASGETSINMYSVSNYVQNNWLYVIGGEWTMSPFSSSALTDPASTFINTDGGYGGTRNYYGYAIRPVVYLDSSVYIVSGDGTESNPYQLAM